MKIVVDTNVIISGVFFGGDPGKLIKAIVSSDVTACATTEIVDEYEEMKSFYKIPIDADGIKEFDSFILEGGFPKTIFLDTLSDKQLYVRSVLNDILVKDIKRRVKIKNIEAFQTVERYVINNFGSTTNINNIYCDLNKSGIAISRETITKYIKALVDAKVLSECSRFDLKSRRSLKNERKYYLADLSIYFALNTDNRINYSPVLENVVYHYAKSMNYNVSVGRIGNFECDFILRNNENDYAYVQVALTIMNSKDTEDREYRPLELIADGYPKYLLTRRDLVQKRSGIKHVDIIDFIREKRALIKEDKLWARILTKQDQILISRDWYILKML